MTHRFINADSLVSTGTGILGHNMFAYCENNPVNSKDVTGSNPKTIDDILIDIASGNSEYSIMDVTIMQMSGDYVLGTSQSSHDANRRPNTGEPGTTWEAPNGDKRTYGPNRKPALDYDHDDHGKPEEHPHDENGGHYHNWDSLEPCGKAYVIEWDIVFEFGVVLAVSALACIGIYVFV